MPDTAATIPEPLVLAWPTGKDLCLDVALRVGKLIAQRLPGTTVIYTRDDDTFIPLERRTEIANEARVTYSYRCMRTLSHKSTWY